MTKKLLILVLLISSCNVNKDILGTYKTDDNNVIDINLTLLPKNKYVLTYYASMVSDSIFGEYKLNKRKIHLISKTESLNFLKTQKDKSKNSKKSSLLFEYTEIGQPSFLGEAKLIINDTLEKKILNDYESKSIKIDCDDKVIFNSHNLSKEIKLLNCMYDYHIMIYIRDYGKIIPDTLIIDFRNGKKIDVLNSQLKKKRKHNTVYKT